MLIIGCTICRLKLRIVIHQKYPFFSVRHNEDGSYTYGYEADDGSFKLETRHVDGRVEGKYGYIDIDSGELKVIEYGADMMGFQPEGDLPEGIVVPPPVPGNATFDYDYDTGDYEYVDQQEPQPDPRVINGDENLVRIQNRARGNTASPIPGSPTQNRGQNVRPPPSPISRPREESRNTVLPTRVPPSRILPTPVPASRTRFQAQPNIQQQSARPQRPRPQPSPQPVVQSAGQQQNKLDMFTAFQTNFDTSSLGSQGLRPFVPRQPNTAQRPPTRPTPPAQRPTARPTPPVQRPPARPTPPVQRLTTSPPRASRPQESVRSLSAAPSRQEQLTKEEEQEFREINEIRKNIRPVGTVRSEIPSQSQRTSQRGTLRRIVAKRPINASAASPESSPTGIRLRGRAREAIRTRTSEAIDKANSQAAATSPQIPKRVNRPTAAVVTATDDPLAVLKSLQETGGRTSPSKTQPNAQKPIISKPPASPTSNELSNSDQKFSSFPARDTGAPTTSSLPARRPQSVSPSQISQSQRPQPIRELPSIPTQQKSQPEEQPRTPQRRPIRIRIRPASTPNNVQQQIAVPQTPPRPVIPPQQQARRPVQPQPASGAIRALPQQTQNRFLPTPNQPVSPTAAATPSRPFQNPPPVDFDALISEFTGRQTPRPQVPQQPFFAFRPTPAANRVQEPRGSRQFVPRPAVAVPLSFNSPVSSLY